tara:strand:+ start:78 stop:1769 length:1692 start_codon:yes stop_codon:yes gene_type:complete
MNFKLFFEAKQEFIDQIQDAIDKVDERPFNELFGDKNRFLVKVYNPNFEQNAKYFDLDIEKFDWKKRTYKDKNINSTLKRILRSYTDKRDKIKKEIDTEEFWDEQMDKVKKNNAYIIDQTILRITASSPKFEPWSNTGEYQLKGKDREDLGVIPVKYVKDFPLNRPLNSDEVRQYIDLFFKKNNGIYFAGFMLGSVEGLVSQKRIEMRAALDEYISPIKYLKQLKQTVDQNNIFYYLLFSRHPIDVLRMSDHKGISSCHRLGGGVYSPESGMYEQCAFADASNDGGIVYLIRGRDKKAIGKDFQQSDIFKDKDREVAGVQPLGRIRLRRFVDLATGKDFAVPTTLIDEQKYGYFTKELHQILLDYTRSHQDIFNNPPDKEYMEKNIVLVGGHYSDETIGTLLRYFFANSTNYTIRHAKNIKMIDWEQETRDIITEFSPELQKVFTGYQWSIMGSQEDRQIKFDWTITIPYDEEKAKALDLEYHLIGQTSSSTGIGHFLHQLINLQLFYGGSDINHILQKNNLVLFSSWYFSDPEEMRTLFANKISAYGTEISRTIRTLSHHLK